MEGDRTNISLGKRLRFCPDTVTLGVKPNWDDYPKESKAAIQDARKIFYPSLLYEPLFRSLGKETFPRNYYRFMGNKIHQTHLFQLAGIPHPRTRLYYGKERSERICADFQYPFIAKTPMRSSKGEGVFLIRCDEDLRRYLKRHHPAYIQEYLRIDRDLRVVLIAGEIAHAYWRIPMPGEFRNNVSQGARISYEDIPEDALDFAREVVRICGFDEVGLDICRAEGRYYVLEANMVFGLEGFRKCGMDIHEILCRMIR